MRFGVISPRKRLLGTCENPDAAPPTTMWGFEGHHKKERRNPARPTLRVQANRNITARPRRTQQRPLRVIHAIAARQDAGRGNGKDMVSVRGWVQIVPEKISVRIDRHALRTRCDVCKRISCRRRDNLIEQREDVQLRDVQVPACIEFQNEGNAAAENGVVKGAGLGCRNRGGGRTVKPRNQYPGEAGLAR